MPVISMQRNDTSQAAIFARLWESRDTGLSPALARHVLKLRFSEEDTQRMHALAAENQEGNLTHDELDELDNFIKIGDLIAILHSKARKLLKQKRAAKRHG